jgi:hypothetical protein
MGTARASYERARILTVQCLLSLRVLSAPSLFSTAGPAGTQPEFLTSTQRQPPVKRGRGSTLRWEVQPIGQRSGAEAALATDRRCGDTMNACTLQKAMRE